jgi:hypothetical protein
MFSRGRLPAGYWPIRRKSLVNECIRQHALPQVLLQVPAAKVGHGCWCRAVDVVDYCAHKQVRYRRQIDLNRSFAQSRRDASKGTRAMRLAKDGQGYK